MLTTYVHKGYVRPSTGLSESEVTALRHECDRLFQLPELHDPANLRVQSRPTGGVADRLDPVIDLSNLLTELTQDPRLTECAAQALGDTPLLMKAKLIAKPPGTGGYGFHQDFTYWQFLNVPAGAITTVAVCLDALSEENGATQFYAGTHNHLLADASMATGSHDVDPASLTDSPVETPTAPAGAVLMWHSRVVHGSQPNRSTEPRRMAFFTYSASRFGNLYDRYYRRFLADRRAGLPAQLQAKAHW